MTRLKSRTRLLFRFSLATLLVVMVIVCVISANIGSSWRDVTRQQRAVNQLRNVGAQIEMKQLLFSRNSPRAWLAWWKVEGADQVPASVYYSPLTNRSTPFSDSQWEALSNLPSVTSVSVNGARASERAIDALMELKDLSHLKLSQALLTDESARRLSTLSNLVDLDVSGSPITDDAITTFKNLTQLEQLNLKGSRATETSVLELWRALPNLTITAANGESIPSHNDIAKVKRLVLGSGFSDESLHCFLPEAKSLTFLYLSGETMTDQALEVLRQNSNLNFLTLDSENFSSGCLKSLQGHQGLFSLSLRMKSCDPQDLKLLASFSNLRHLELHGAAVTDEQLSIFSELDPRLAYLSLRNSSITGSGLSALKGFQIRELDLSHTRITDEGLRALPPLSELLYLNLSETSITLDGLDHLRTLPVLDVLGLEQCQILATDRTIADRKLPGCMMTFGAGGPFRSYEEMRNNHEQFLQARSAGLYK